MTYKVDESLDDFEPWGNAEEIRSIIWAYDDEHNTHFWNQACSLADDIFNDGESYTATDVNDWLAFDLPNDLDFAEVFNMQ